MAMEKHEREAIKKKITAALRRKFEVYSPEGKTVMPFHTRLLGDDRMALFSFIHSLNTTFGTVIYEPVAEQLALGSGNFTQVICRKKSGGIISEGAQAVINKIMNEAGHGTTKASQESEVKRIRVVCREGEEVEVKLRLADIYLVSESNCHYPIDIKTTKPNIDGFEKYKETMLKWTASILYEDGSADVRAMVGLPYNPNHPLPYQHWTMGNTVELGTQIKVGEQFWDFLAGKPVFDDLMACFKEVGMEMRDEVDEYFLRFRKE